MKMKSAGYIISTLILVSFNASASIDDEYYSYDKEATYKKLSESAYEITLTAWTDKPYNYVDGNNPLGAHYFGPYGIVNAGDCTVDLQGPNKQIGNDNYYGWSFTSSRSNEACSIIDYITPVDPDDSMYFEHTKRNDGYYDVRMKFVLHLKEGVEFEPAKFITVMPWVHTHARMSDQYKIK